MNKNLVLFSLKNVSEYPLNITADELMERFTRGDVSRTTEGSGLGLSIAQNLTKMQGGEFKLYVDGDLFKVMISFPRIRPKVEKPTEGSGLGLSIAQNLTKMQGGEFKLYVDGDLFKVMISFPRIRPKVEKPEWAEKAEKARSEMYKEVDETKE